MSYANAAFWTQVILADRRDPDVSWEHHLERGSSGGVDLVARVGSSLYAPCDGVVQNVPWYGSGGHTVRIFHGNGNYDEYMHLSSFAVQSGTRVRLGDVIGYSGASGFGSIDHYAPHWHWHLYLGSRRVNPWHYFDTPWPGSAAAGGGATPIPKPIPIEEKIMTEALYKGSSDTVYWQADPNSPLVPINSPQFNAQVANGLKLVTISDADLGAMQIRFGTLARPVGSTATGYAYRNKDDGSIYWQAEPGSPLVSITLEEWKTLQQNGLLYVDYTAEQIAGLLAHNER